MHVKISLPELSEGHVSESSVEMIVSGRNYTEDDAGVAAGAHGFCR